MQQESGLGTGGVSGLSRLLSSEVVVLAPIGSTSLDQSLPRVPGREIVTVGKIYKSSIYPYYGYRRVLLGCPAIVLEDGARVIVRLKLSPSTSSPILDFSWFDSFSRETQTMEYLSVFVSLDWNQRR
jgi:hypothetical protein